MAKAGHKRTLGNELLNKKPFEALQDGNNFILQYLLQKHIGNKDSNRAYVFLCFYCAYVVNYFNAG